MATTLPTSKPKGKLILTDTIEQSYFNCLIYGETDSWKTTVAAQFGKPESTLLVVTRRIEQALPLKGLGYRIYYTTDVDDVELVLREPQRVLPELAGAQEPLIVLDDISAFRDLVLEESSWVERGGVLQPVTDTRTVYQHGTERIRTIVRTALNGRYHFIAIALANVTSNPITHEEQITPDLSPAMLRSILPDFEHVFYVDKRLKYVYTAPKTDNYEEIVDGRPVRHRRTIFAKHKAPLGRVKQVQAEYPLTPDVLRRIWEAIR
jgi:hypothetical protein